MLVKLKIVCLNEKKKECINFIGKWIDFGVVIKFVSIYIYTRYICCNNIENVNTVHTDIYVAFLSLS